MFAFIRISLQLEKVPGHLSGNEANLGLEHSLAALSSHNARNVAGLAASPECHLSSSPRIPLRRARSRCCAHPTPGGQKCPGNLVRSPEECGVKPG